jgi:hypothetical protein
MQVMKNLKKALALYISSYNLSLPGHLSLLVERH